MKKPKMLFKNKGLGTCFGFLVFGARKLNYFSHLKKNLEEKKMNKYLCPCGYAYDPEIGDPDNGIAPGTPWDEVPEDWVCPICGLSKEDFEEVDE